MNYTEIFASLQSATLFDLFRLRVGIDAMLEDSERLLAIKRQLMVGMTISYFSYQDNKLVDAVVESIHRTTVTARDLLGGKRWRVNFYSINLDGVETDIRPQHSQTQLDKNQLQVGETVGFYGSQNQELYGTIVKLNPKTVSLVTREGARWRVGYSLLFKVMDGETGEELRLIASGVEWVEDETKEVC